MRGSRSCRAGRRGAEARGAKDAAVIRAAKRTATPTARLHGRATDRVGRALQTDPINRGVVLRTLATAAAFGAFLGFVGAFNTWKLPLLARIPYMMAMAMATTLPSILVYRLTCRIP